MIVSIKFDTSLKELIEPARNNVVSQRVNIKLWWMMYVGIAFRVDSIGLRRQLEAVYPVFEEARSDDDKKSKNGWFGRPSLFCFVHGKQTHPTKCMQNREHK